MFTQRVISLFSSVPMTRPALAGLLVREGLKQETMYADYANADSRYWQRDSRLQV